jgi:Tfp pilus assembly protein PilE
MPPHAIKQKTGFSLIEMIIYITLFSLIMTGTLLSAYQLIASSAQTEAKVTIQEEGNFIVRKISFALTGLSDITTPSLLSATSSTLVVSKHNYSGNPITIRFNIASSSIEMAEGVGDFVSLSTQNVVVSDLQFTFISGAGTLPNGVTAAFSINGVPFGITKYLRK